MRTALQIDPVAMSRARRELLTDGRALRSGITAVNRISTDVLEGAGELADDLAVGLAAFRVSWLSVIDVLADSTELVGEAVDRARAVYLEREAAIARTMDRTGP